MPEGRTTFVPSSCGASRPGSPSFSPRSGPTTRSRSARCSRSPEAGALGPCPEPLEPRQRAGAAGRRRHGGPRRRGGRAHGHQRDVVQPGRGGGGHPPHAVAGDDRGRRRLVAGDRRPCGRPRPGRVRLHLRGNGGGGGGARARSRRRAAGCGALVARRRWRSPAQGWPCCRWCHGRTSSSATTRARSPRAGGGDVPRRGRASSADRQAGNSPGRVTRNRSGPEPAGAGAPGWVPPGRSPRWRRRAGPAASRRGPGCTHVRCPQRRGGRCWAPRAGGTPWPWSSCRGGSSRAHSAAFGTCASALRLGSPSSSTGRPSRSHSTCSAASTATASTRCRSSETTGNAVIAARSAIRTSTCGSVLVRPITDGTSSTRSRRPASDVWSLTRRASAARSGCVHAGWSLHGSPARYDTISMKHAPFRGLRCLPRDSSGISSGTRGPERNMRRSQGIARPLPLQSAPSAAA